MLALAITVALASIRAGTGGCPYGNVEFVEAEAQADYTVRFVNSQAAADCVIRWTSVAPGPGFWREVTSWPDFRVYVTTGIADFTVLAQ